MVVVKSVPVGVGNLGSVESVKLVMLKLIFSVVCATAEVVAVVPELLRSACANVEHQACRVITVRPLADVVERDMASYRIADSDVVDIGGVHSGLADRGPMLESGVDDSSLGEYLAKCIVVKNGGLERVADLCPVYGSLSVAIHGDRADEYEVSLIRLPQFFYRTEHRQRRAVVCAYAFLRMCVCHWGDKGADRQNIIHVLYTLVQAFVVSEIAPNNLYLLSVRLEHILIEIGLSCKHADVEFVEMCGKLLESSKAHGSGHAGYKHFLFHIFAPFGIFRIACL